MSELSTLVEQRLAALRPLRVHIEDDSHRHAGHAGNNGGGHLTLHIVADAFTGLGTLARHRLVYQQVSDLIPHRLHALAITARTPDET